MRCLAVLLLCSLAAAQDKLVTELLGFEAPPRDYLTDPVAVAFGEPGPPPADAPLPDLLDYWAGGRSNMPPAAVRERILAACKADPERIRLYSSILPATEEARQLIEAWVETVRNRLDDWGVEQAIHAVEQEPYDPNFDEHAFDELAESDWKRAEPLARKLADGDDDDLKVVALGELMRHGDAEARTRLKTVVEEAGTFDRARNRAFRRLAGNPFEGFDEWCLTFFDDEDLDLFPAVRARPDHWVPILARHVVDQREEVRARAIDHLARLPARADALRPLLPWLTDPDWADKPKRGRMQLLMKLAKVDVPESVPGLLKILAGDEGIVLDSRVLRALARHGPKEAGPLLRRRLPWMTSRVLAEPLCRALLACGTLRRDEQIAALIAYGKGRADGRFGRRRYHRKKEPDAQEMLGWEIALAGPTDEAIVTAMLERSGELPALAEMVHEWPGKTSDLDLVRRLARGDLSAASIAVAMRRREQVAGHARAELDRLREGTAGGIAAALLGETERVLQSEDRAAQRALLACARLVRMELPIDTVARLLPLDAAHDYLETIDTSAARAHLSGVVGYGRWPIAEERLRVGMGEAKEVFALQHRWFLGESEITIRIFDDHALLTWTDWPGRYRWRTLDPVDARRFVDFVKRHRIDELPPVLPNIDSGGHYYYLHLTRDRGWRIHIENPHSAEGSDVYRTLVRRFERLCGEGVFQSRYGENEQFPALEVLVKEGAYEVWAKGDDIRVLRDEWMTLEDEETDPPPAGATGFVFAPAGSGDFDRKLPGGKTLHWISDRGISIEEGGKEGWLHEGECRWPLITPDGRWLVIAIAQDSWDGPNELLRVDLASGEASKVDLPARVSNHPVAWLPAHGKILVVHGGQDAVLLDPATGKSEAINGVVWPFLELDDERPRLQSTGKPGEYWAAKGDDEGTDILRYETKTFTVTVERHFPGLRFETRELYIDGTRAYVCYFGDLVRLPMPTR